MSWLGRMFGSASRSSTRALGRIFFFNTLTERKDVFTSLKPGQVTMYTCGPTVYSKQHIGNLRTAFFSDSIARVLTHAGFIVRRVINITDVGHMVSDTDEGEDKMAVGAAKEQLTPEEIASKYAKIYIEDLRDLNLPINEIIFPRATEYIKEQIALARTLEEKGFAYKISDGLYFDTSRFPTYGKLGGIGHAALKEGARVAINHDKRHASDFALWRIAKKGDLQQWDSPWGRGNPGWHIECSAMSRALLGVEIDIHTGGEDLAMIHHNDEIAQSEAANGRQFVRFWMHGAFLNMAGEKISKSLGNVTYLSDIIDRGHHPLSLRYLFLQAHYRTPVSFSWDAVAGADEALRKLWRISREVAKDSGKVGKASIARDRFVTAVRDDLSTPQALGILWETLKSDDFSPEQKWGLLEEADALLGLKLIDPPVDAQSAIPLSSIGEEVQELITKREKARKDKDFATADSLREQIEVRGYHVEDSGTGPVLTRRLP